MSTEQEKSNAKKALLLLFAVNLLNFFDRQLPGVLGEPIRKEFGLTDAQLGLARHRVHARVRGRRACRSAGSPTPGCARGSSAIGLTVWSALTAVSGVVTGYAGLVAARLGVGIGEATCSPACQSLIGDLYPPEKRSRALGAFMLGLPFGLCLSYLTGAWLGAEYGWRTCFVIAAVPGFIVALLILKLPEPPRGAADAPRTAEPRTPAGGVSAFVRVLRIKTLWWIVISGALHNFNVYAINAFQTPFLQRYHMLNLRNAALVSALVVGLVGAIGLLGGWLGLGPTESATRRRAPAARGRHDDGIGALCVPRARAAVGIHRVVHDSDGARHHAELRLLRDGVRGHPGRRRAAAAWHRRRLSTSSRCTSWARAWERT